MDIEEVKNLILQNVYDSKIDEDVLNEIICDLSSNNVDLIFDFLKESGIEIETNEESLDIDVSMFDNATKMYLKEISKYPILSKEQERNYALLAQSGDKDAKNKLLEHNLRYVVKIAKKYLYTKISLLDLIQEGNFGLIAAIERYNPDFGARLLTYADYYIEQAIRSSIPKQNNGIETTQYFQATLKKINLAKEEIRTKFNREATMEEIEELTGYSEEKIKRYMLSDIKTISLSQKISDEEDFVIGDFIEDKHAINPEEVSVNLLLIEELFVHLTEKQKQVIILRFGLYGGKVYTQKEVAKILNVTHARIQQIENKALRYLKIVSKKQTNLEKQTEIANSRKEEKQRRKIVIEMPKRKETTSIVRTEKSVFEVKNAPEIKPTTPSSKERNNCVVTPPKIKTNSETPIQQQNSIMFDTNFEIDKYDIKRINPKITEDEFCSIIEILPYYVKKIFTNLYCIIPEYKQFGFYFKSDISSLQAQLLDNIEKIIKELYRYIFIEKLSIDSTIEIMQTRSIIFLYPSLNIGDISKRIDSSLDKNAIAVIYEKNGCELDRIADENDLNYITALKNLLLKMPNKNTTIINMNKKYSPVRHKESRLTKEEIDNIAKEYYDKLNGLINLEILIRIIASACDDYYKKEINLIPIEEIIDRSIILYIANMYKYATDEIYHQVLFTLSRIYNDYINSFCEFSPTDVKLIINATLKNVDGSTSYCDVIKRELRDLKFIK